MPGKQALLEDEKPSGRSKDPLAEKTVTTHAIPATSPAASLRRAELAPQALTAQNVQQLQRTVGNQAVGQLLSGPAHSKAPTLQRLWISESAHYGQDRDAAHSKAKDALLAADSDQAISDKIFKKHRNAKHTGKCVTSFKTSPAGFLVTVTYANLTKGKEALTYDTAFLSKTKAAAPEKTAITYNPDSPTIPVT